MASVTSIHRSRGLCSLTHCLNMASGLCRSWLLELSLRRLVCLWSRLQNLHLARSLLLRRTKTQTSVSSRELRWMASAKRRSLDLQRGSFIYVSGLLCQY